MPDSTTRPCRRFAQALPLLQLCGGNAVHHHLERFVKFDDDFVERRMQEHHEFQELTALICSAQIISEVLADIEEGEVEDVELR